MSVYSLEYHAMVIVSGSRLGGKPSPSRPTRQHAGEKLRHQGESFFHHLLDVINPLQHLPVIGTIYRAITGEHIGPVEKIAGDTLYGGLWGAVSSVADVAFEGITGKSFEDTALAWIKGDDRPTCRRQRQGRGAPAIAAANTARPPTCQRCRPRPSLPRRRPRRADIAALTNALSAKGVDNDTASRALYAYRRSMGMAAQPVFASVN